MGLQSNAQGEVQLLAEWLKSLPAWFQSKTHVRMGQELLFLDGKALTHGQQRATLLWSDWADVRIFTGMEVWIVEAKLVATSNAYGQVLAYCDEYRDSDDYKQFYAAPIIPVVVAAVDKPRNSTFFVRYGVRTIIFTPTWSLSSIQTKTLGDLTGL